jgi:hypothetical protein
MATKDISQTVKRSSTTKGEKTGKAVDDSNVEQAPTTPVMTADEASRAIENDRSGDNKHPNASQG